MFHDYEWCHHYKQCFLDKKKAEKIIEPVLKILTELNEEEKTYVKTNSYPRGWDEKYHKRLEDLNIDGVDSFTIGASVAEIELVS